MSEQKWTKEPWAVDIDEPYAIKTIEAEPWYVAKAEKFVNENGLPKDSERNANADRIVACVNGCTGLNPEAFAECVSVLARLYEYYHHGETRAEAVFKLDEAKLCISKARGEAK